MSAESHRKFLEQRALRAAQKAIDRNGRDRFNKEDFASLRIQTIEPWKRLTLAVFGLAFCATGFLAMKSDRNGLAFFLYVAALLSFSTAIFGVKKTVDGALNGINVADIFDGLFS